MEVLPVDIAVRDAIARSLSTDDIQSLALKSGMVSLKEAGLLKVRSGITSLSTALEVTGV